MEARACFRCHIAGRHQRNEKARHCNETVTAHQRPSYARPQSIIKYKKLTKTLSKKSSWLKGFLSGNEKLPHGRTLSGSHGSATLALRQDLANLPIWLCVRISGICHFSPAPAHFSIDLAFLLLARHSLSSFLISTHLSYPLPSHPDPPSLVFTTVNKRSVRRRLCPAL